MCARVKQDGRLVIKGKGVNEVVDYGFENIVLLDASDRWTPTFDIMGQLKEIAQEMRRDGINPDMLILGSKAADMLLKNERYLKLLDNRRVEIGEIKPGELEQGVGYLGRMIVPGAMFDLYTYEELRTAQILHSVVSSNESARKRLETRESHSTAEDEKNLDIYEGYPKFYTKKELKIAVRSLNGDDLGKLTAMVYIMTKKAVKARRNNPLPNPYYYSVLDAGYKAFGFDDQILKDAMTEAVSMLND